MREAGADDEAAAWSVAALQDAADDRDALAHADESVPRAVALAARAAVVGDLELELLRAVANDDGRASRFETGVPLLAETAAEFIGL